MQFTKYKPVLRNDLLHDGVYFVATFKPNHNYSVNKH